MKVAKHVLSVLLLSLLCAVSTWAQENAELKGTVTDPSGAVVPQATITITNTSTGEIKTTTSNGAGLYDFSNLHIGTYNLKVDAKGFNPAQTNGIVMNVASTVQQNVTLTIGAGVQTVTVEADAMHRKPKPTRSATSSPGSRLPSSPPTAATWSRSPR